MEDALRLGFVHAAEGHADMHDDVIADLRLRDEGEVHFLDDAAKAHAPGTLQWIASGDAQHSSWNG